MISAITDPNVVYICFLLGIYGLFFELYNPGLLLPGIVGVGCLLLALYALQDYPTNYNGLALLSLGMVFMLVEGLLGSYGILGFLGILSFVFGSLYLFDPGQEKLTLSWQLIALMAVLTAIFFLTVINLGVGSTKQKKMMGTELIIGKIGEVLTTKDEFYQVRILGEIWNAQSEKQVHSGDKVRVIAVEGMLLTVEPA